MLRCRTPLIVFALPLIVTLFGAAPSVVVIDGHHVGVPTDYAQGVTAQVIERLQAAGFETAATSCAPTPQCAPGAAGGLGATSAVVVTMARELSDVSVEVQVLTVEGATLGSKAFRLPRAQPELGERLEAVIAFLRADAPTAQPKATLTPSPRPSSPPAKPMSTATGVGIGLLVTGAALTVAAIIGLVIGVTHRAAYQARCSPVALDANCHDGNNGRPPHPLRQTANLGFNIGLFTGIPAALALVAGGIAVGVGESRPPRGDLLPASKPQ